MNLNEALKQWMNSPNRHHWRPDEDELDGELRNAFAAGWNAARPTIRGTSTGNATHNSDSRPGKLVVTIWGHTRKGRSIALDLDEEAVKALQADLTRCGF